MKEEKEKVLEDEENMEMEIEEMDGMVRDIKVNVEEMKKEEG